MRLGRIGIEFYGFLQITLCFHCLILLPEDPAEQSPGGCIVRPKFRCHAKGRLGPGPLFRLHERISQFELDDLGIRCATRGFFERCDRFRHVAGGPVPFAEARIKTGLCGVKTADQSSQSLQTGVQIASIRNLGQCTVQQIIRTRR